MDQWRNQRGNLKIPRSKWQQRYHTPKPKRKVYNNTNPPQETRKTRINKLTLHLNHLDRGEQKRPKVSRRKEIIKIRAEINEIETKKTTEKINGTKRSTKLINPYPDFSITKERRLKSIKLEMKEKMQ